MPTMSAYCLRKGLNDNEHEQYTRSVYITHVEEWLQLQNGAYDHDCVG